MKAAASSRKIAAPDPSWRLLYAWGGGAALLYVIMIIVPITFVAAFPQPPGTGGKAVLEYIASMKTVYLVELVCFVGLSVPALVVFLSVSVALKDLDRSLAAIGALVGCVSEILALALNASPPSLNGQLVYLSDLYAGAATDAQRLALSTAAEGLIAGANAVSSAGILTALGILILSCVMLKGIFARGVAWVGVAAGAAGMVSEALRPIIGFAYILYGLLLPTWFLLVGWKLHQVGRRV